MSEVRYQCPCCGYYTLNQRDYFEICVICGWEDDWGFEIFGQDAPEQPRGPNSVHLWQARQNFLAFGRKDERARLRLRGPLLEELPENNQHQPRYRPTETLAPDLDLKPPLAPPRLTRQEAIEIARTTYSERTPFIFDVAYGSTTYPRFRRIDDGVILEPDGTRDFWRVYLNMGLRTYWRRGRDGPQQMTMVERYLVLVDDKRGQAVLACSDGQRVD